MSQVTGWVKWQWRWKNGDLRICVYPRHLNSTACRNKSCSWSELANILTSSTTSPLSHHTLIYWNNMFIQRFNWGYCTLLSTFPLSDFIGMIVHPLHIRSLCPDMSGLKPFTEIVKNAASTSCVELVAAGLENLKLGELAQMKQPWTWTMIAQSFIKSKIHSF